MRRLSLLVMHEVFAGFIRGIHVLLCTCPLQLLYCFLVRVVWLDLLLFVLIVLSLGDQCMVSHLDCRCAFVVPPPPLKSPLLCTIVCSNVHVYVAVPRAVRGCCPPPPRGGGSFKHSPWGWWQGRVGGP